MLFGDKKLKDVLKDSSLLTLIAFIVSYPYLYHWLVHKPDYLSPFNNITKGMTTQQLEVFTLAHIAILLFLLLISSFVGFGFSRKYGFKGLGNIENLRNDTIYIFMITLPLGLVIFFTYDVHLLSIIPTFYPQKPIWGIAKALMTSVNFEIVSKFGLITITMGVFKNRHIAVLIPSLFFTLLVGNTFREYAVHYGLNYISIFGTVLTFAYSIVSGYIFITRGLLTVVVLRFVLDMKYFIYPLLVSGS